MTLLTIRAGRFQAARDSAWNGVAWRLSRLGRWRVRNVVEIALGAFGSRDPDELHSFRPRVVLHLLPPPEKVEPMAGLVYVDACATLVAGPFLVVGGQTRAHPPDRCLTDGPGDAAVRGADPMPPDPFQSWTVGPPFVVTQAAQQMAALIRRDESNGVWRCRYCRTEVVQLDQRWSDGDLPFPERDHVLPRRRGGSNALANLVVACAGCNVRKGSKSLSELPPRWHAWRNRPVVASTRSQLR